MIEVRSAYIRNNLETVELDNMIYQTGMILRSYYLTILLSILLSSYSVQLKAELIEIHYKNNF